MLDPEPLEVRARLLLSGDRLSGELCAPDGRTIQFSGWIGLLGALEAAQRPRPGWESGHDPPAGQPPHDGPGSR